MEPSESTSSPRDHAADENPDLARKKQKLSPARNDNDSGASPDSNIVIEDVTAADDLGPSMATAIHIEEEVSQPYADAFGDDHLQKLHTLLTKLVRNEYVLLSEFNWFSKALCQHLLDTSAEHFAWKRHYIDEESDLFSAVARTAYHLVFTADLFSAKIDLGRYDVQDSFTDLVCGTIELTERILPLLPDAVKRTLARRDSAQASSRPQEVGLLSYVSLAQILMAPTPAITQMLQYRRQASLIQRLACLPEVLSQDDMLSKLVKLLQIIAGALRELANAWQTFHHGLLIFKDVLDVQWKRGESPKEAIETVFEIIQERIRPTIAGKHPRALPEGFHDLVISLGEKMLSMYSKSQRPDCVSEAYERFVKSSDDALVPATAESDSVLASLSRISGNNTDVLACLLSTSWAFQSARSFLRSDVMDVRSIGTNALSVRLVQIYQNFSEGRADSEHPVVQYAVRFMRKNEIAAYIFGPESHAGLISQSHNIIAFLAATHTLTTVEIDLMWHACCTSVEADFVQAALSLLKFILQYMDFRSLLCLAGKYASTPLSEISGQAAEMLQDVLQRLETSKNLPIARDERLELALTTLSILKHADVSIPSPHAALLRQHALTQLGTFGQPAFAFERGEIYKACIPEIENCTENATTAVEVLNVLIAAASETDDPLVVTKQLSLASALRELAHYATTNTSATTATVQAIAARLHCILWLVTLAGGRVDHVLTQSLFDQLFGASAVDPHIRDATWQKLTALTSERSRIAITANILCQKLTDDFVPQMSADLASPSLVAFATASLKKTCQSQEVKSNWALLLQEPLWQTLVRFATCSSLRPTIDCAAQGVLELLFYFPVGLSVSPIALSACHSDFVSAQVNALVDAYNIMMESKNPNDEAAFGNNLVLLNQVLCHSRTTLQSLSMLEEPKALLVGDFSNSPEHVTARVEVHGPAEPLTVPIKVTSTATVADLHASLRKTIGRIQYKVILCGKDITAAEPEKVCELLAKSPGVLHICPRIKPEDDIDMVMPIAGPVEQAILARYDSIEAFLDGPDHAAQKTYDFLRIIRLPHKSRSKVVSPYVSIDELFPPDKLYRTRYWLHVLQRHMLELRQVAVVDQAFARLTVKRLAAVVVDQARPFHEELMYEFLHTLQTLLKELPRWQEWSYDTALISDASALVARLCGVVSLAKESLSPISRTSFASVVYGTLLQAYRTDGLVFDFVQKKEDQMVWLHGLLLIDEDQAFSSWIYRRIREFWHGGDGRPARSPFTWVFRNLQDALVRPELTQSYFAALVYLFGLARIENDETQMMTVTKGIFDALDAYIQKGHKESCTLLIKDPAMSGLLEIAVLAVKSLKKYGKRIGLDSYPVRILHNLLLPPQNGESLPLANEGTRMHAYNLLRATFGVETDYAELVQTVLNAIRIVPNDPSARYQGVQDWLRRPDCATGLSNLGMTCYMNSLLQQLYGNLQFRKFILEQSVEDSQRQMVLAALQHLFARMQNSTNPSEQTNDLAGHLNVQVGIQEDVHTFYTTLLSQLEDCMLNAQKKAELTNFFTGKSVTQIRGECGHVSAREESFTELSITVKNKANLYDSLNEFVQGEPLEGANRYKCMACDPDSNGRLVNAMRRTCLDKVPDSLTFCLKRFAFDSMHDGENKVNDRFEFPSEIDMSLYGRGYLEDPSGVHSPDMFELVGVIVHQGSLSFGHYWSYVRVPGMPNSDQNAWLYVEDSRSFRVGGGLSEVQEQCFGGLTWTDGSERPESGYVLFYQRRSYFQQASLLNTVPLQMQVTHDILPRVQLSQQLARAIEKDNQWRNSIATFFENGFSSFVLWLIGKCPDVAESGVSTAVMEGSETRSSDVTDDLATWTAHLLGQYTLRIVLCDPNAENYLVELQARLRSLLDVQPGTANTVLRAILDHDLVFAAIAKIQSEKVRTAVMEMIQTCLLTLRDYSPTEYEDCLNMVLCKHVDALKQVVENMPFNWKEYLSFASSLAALSDEETAKVLDAGYISWAIEIINMPNNPELVKQHAPLWKMVKGQRGVEFVALYGFLYDVLSANVDLTTPFRELAYDKRMRTPLGCTLRADELSALFDVDRGNPASWRLFATMCRYCTVSGTWKDFAPAKLVGLLAGASDELSPVVEKHLLAHIDFEDRELVPLLWTTLHFCRVRSDNECGKVIQSLSRNLVLWEDCSKRSLAFFRLAFDLAPISVLQSISVWLPQGTFLYNKSAVIRKASADTIEDILFTDDPLSGTSDHLDATRIHTTRHLLRLYLDEVVTAYEAEKPRAEVEAKLSILKGAHGYICRLEEAIESQPDPLAPGVQAEWDETRTIAVRLVEAMLVLNDWEGAETALPTRNRVEPEISAADDAEYDSEDMLGPNAQLGPGVGDDGDDDSSLDEYDDEDLA